jgi:SNF2 family DNA or RNA helicase
VAPLALIHQWKREIENRTKNGMFSVHIHHGSTQLKKVGDFLQYDVVITTYGTLMAGYRKRQSQVVLIEASNQIPKKKNMTDVEREYWQDWLEERKGVMFQLEWYRIILDEAQYLL